MVHPLSSSGDYSTVTPWKLNIFTEKNLFENASLFLSLTTARYCMIYLFICMHHEDVTQDRDDFAFFSPPFSHCISLNVIATTYIFLYWISEKLPNSSARSYNWPNPIKSLIL